MNIREIIARIRDCQTIGECLILADELERPFVEVEDVDDAHAKLQEALEG